MTPNKGILWETIQRDTQLSKGDRVRHVFKVAVPDVIGDPDQAVRDALTQDGAKQDLTESINSALGEGKSIKVTGLKTYSAGDSSTIFRVAYRVTQTDGTLTPASVSPPDLPEDTPTGVSLSLQSVQRYSQTRLLIGAGLGLGALVAVGAIGLD